jgi:predicted phage-related endonuclease
VSYQILRCENEADWLERRKAVVTSTEVSALFDANPYLTAAQLWAQKFTQIFPVRRINPRMQEGLDQEAAIAKRVADMRGWEAKPFPKHMFAQSTERKLGASFDWCVRDEKGVRPFEIKKLHLLAMGRYWLADGNRITRVSPYVEFQMQTQMGICGFDGEKLGVKCGDAGWYLYGEWTPSFHLWRLICARVDEFWESITKGIPCKGATRTRIWAQYQRLKAA